MMNSYFMGSLNPAAIRNVGDPDPGSLPPVLQKGLVFEVPEPESN